MYDRIWLFGDYNQAEVRVVAWKAPVPKLRARFESGLDVHNYVCSLIAKVIQENKIQTPINVDTGKPLFNSKPPEEYKKGDEERELSKRAVHAYDYGMGAEKFGLIANIPESLAEIILKIYGALFPEIKGKYHVWVENCLRRGGDIWMPDPVKFRKRFYGRPDDPNVIRSAYSCYPQCTVASMLNRTISICSNIFKNDEECTLREQWEAWYGADNWDAWRKLRDSGIRSPRAILWGGMDIRLNVHDAGGLSVPNDPDLLRWAATTWKKIGETPIQINPGHPEDDLVIPIDFKVGPTWGSSDLKDYKV